MVNSPKSSTFAPDFALNASERQTAAKYTEIANAENQPLTKKVLNLLKKVAKNLVSPKKSSTFAADFAMNASERLKTAKLLENCKAENQPLTKKKQNLLKKVAKKFGQSKKKQYLCSRFRKQRK